MYKNVEEIKKIYTKIKPEIEKAKKGYEKAFKYNDKDLFGEICFCLLTPQSKAKNAWQAILNLKSNNLLYTGNEEEISEYLNIVRFKNNKAKYIVKLRNNLTVNGKLNPRIIFNQTSDIFKLREEIEKNITGIGLKEASHLLRNVGFGEHVAILDRHILKNLVKMGVINEIPTLTKKNYYEIEEKMKKFSKYIKIDMLSLDLVLWYKEAGEVFK